MPMASASRLRFSLIGSAGGLLREIAPSASASAGAQLAPVFFADWRGPHRPTSWSSVPARLRAKPLNQFDVSVSPHLVMPQANAGTQDIDVAAPAIRVLVLHLTADEGKPIRCSFPACLHHYRPSAVRLYSWASCSLLASRPSGLAAELPGVLAVATGALQFRLSRYSLETTR